MKKYIVFSLLCGLIGITYVQAVSLKRAWECRHTRMPMSELSKKRIAKNKCTEAEIKAGKGMVGKTLGVGIPIAIGATMVGAGSVGAARRATFENELITHSGSDWKNECRSIVNESGVSDGAKKLCFQHIEYLEKMHQQEGKQRLKEGRADRKLYGYKSTPFYK